MDDKVTHIVIAGFSDVDIVRPPELHKFHYHTLRHFLYIFIY